MRCPFVFQQGKMLFFQAAVALLCFSAVYGENDFSIENTDFVLGAGITTTSTAVPTTTRETPDFLFWTKQYGVNGKNGDGNKGYKNRYHVDCRGLQRIVRR